MGVRLDQRGTGGGYWKRQGRSLIPANSEKIKKGVDAVHVLVYTVLNTKVEVAMKLKEAIERLLADNGKNKSWLSEKMGYPRPTAVSNMLMRGNIQLDTLCRICELFEYEITIQPRRKKGTRPEKQIVLEIGEEAATK